VWSDKDHKDDDKTIVACDCGKRPPGKIIKEVDGYFILEEKNGSCPFEE
jgi:hypothetical protein